MLLSRHHKHSKSDFQHHTIIINASENIYIIKRGKFKQWWSTIPPKSSKTRYFGGMPKKPTTIFLKYFKKHTLSSLFWVYDATSNNISVISWRLVLLMEETWVLWENHRPVTSHWQTSSHNVVSSTPHQERDSTRNYSDDRHWLHR